MVPLPKLYPDRQSRVSQPRYPGALTGIMT